MIEVYKFDNIMSELGMGGYATTENYYNAVRMYDEDCEHCLSFENYVKKNINAIIK